MYLFLYTFFEFIFFAYSFWTFIKNRKSKKIILLISTLFIVFQFVLFLSTRVKVLDSVTVGTESIVIFVFIFLFFIETFKEVTDIPLFKKPNFWFVVGILIYLGSTFFFNILANEIPQKEVDEYWYFTYIGDIIKNIFFTIGVILYFKQLRKKTNKPTIPNLDFNT